MIEKLEEYKKKIENWAEERNIYGGSDYYKQLLKLGEEFSELLVAINKEDENEIKDAIGDMFVCAVNVGKFLNVNVLDFFQQDKIDRTITEHEIVTTTSTTLMRTNQKNTFELKILVFTLYQYCVSMSIDFLECINLAWNTIKDRKGKLINGKFVKEE